jgi:hypothetical protein
MVGCDTKEQLFSTLAYQLAINVTAMREHVERAMMEDPSLPMKSAATQLQKLIVEPLKLVPIPRPSPTLLVDGLDECEGQESQEVILAMISQVLADPAVTLRFIISSLPGQQYEGLCRIDDVLILDPNQDGLHFRTPCIYVPAKRELSFFFCFHTAPPPH